MRTEHDELQQALSDCLSFLENAAAALYDYKELDSDLMLWYEKIDELFDDMLARYENLS
jgi:hypothetical protein